MPVPSNIKIIKWLHEIKPTPVIIQQMNKYEFNDRLCFFGMSLLGLFLKVDNDSVSVEEMKQIKKQVHKSAKHFRTRYEAHINCLKN